MTTPETQPAFSSESSEGCDQGTPASKRTFQFRTTWVILSISLVCAMIVEITAGTVYLFGLYGPQLSDQLGWNQKQTAFVAGCMSWGVSLSGPLIGTIVDKHAKTPWPVFLSGGFLIALGYSLVSATYSGILPWTNFGIVSIYYFLVGVGSAACYHCALATNIRNWPASRRGIAVGVPVSFFGLSAFVYARVASVFFYQTTRDEGSGGEKLDISRFLLFVGACAVLASLLAATLLRDYRDAFVRGASGERRPLLRRVRWDDDGESDMRVEVGGTLPVWKQLDAYLVAVTFFTLVGTGLMYSAGIGTLVLSLSDLDEDSSSGHVQRTQNLHVTLFSLSSFGGRLCTGMLSDFAAVRFGMQRIVFTSLAGIILTSASGLMVVLVDDLASLRVITILVGLGFGIVWTSTPTLIGEFFGNDKFATYWGWTTVTAAFAGQILMLIFGWLYDIQKEDDKFCKGRQCFAGTFVVTSFICLISLFLTFIVYWRRNR